MAACEQEPDVANFRDGEQKLSQLLEVGKVKETDSLYRGSVKQTNKQKTLRRTWPT